MMVLTHFQVDPLPIRAVAWCPSQVSTHDNNKCMEGFMHAPVIILVTLFKAAECLAFK